MPVATELELKQRLFDAYGGFADRRVRKIDRSAPFIVDDRADRDLDARKQLFSWFCQMFTTVKAADRVQLHFRGGIPQSDAVDAWFAAHNAESTGGGIAFDVQPETLAALEDLAQAFEAIIRGRYDTPAYKYVVPRVAGSIRHLHDLLKAAWA